MCMFGMAFLLVAVLLLLILIKKFGESCLFELSQDFNLLLETNHNFRRDGI